MRFDYLNLKAFGHFTDYILSFDTSKNFHLLYGPNEAGKSTTLRSINDFLYGFPQKTNDAFLHSNSKLRIEGQLRDSKGGALAFIRRKGRKDTILDLNGNPLNEKVVEQFLNGIPNSQFSNMFALDHVILREGGESLLQSGGSAGESVFSAASGINILRKIMDNLTKETGNLYKKSGSNPKLNKLLQEEKALNNKIKETQLKLYEWKELEGRYQQGKKEIDELIKKIKNLGSKQKKLNRIKLMLPKISKQQDINEKIVNLGDIPNLPEDVVEIRTNAETQWNAAQKDIKRIEGEMEDLNRQLGQITIPEKILEQATIIDSLYRDVTTYQNNVNTIPEMEGKRKQLSDQVITIMKEIDSFNADIENMDIFRLSAEKKETIRELIRKKPLLDSEQINLKKEFKKLETELVNKQGELTNIPELPEIDELDAVIDKVKRAGAIEENIGKLEKSCSQKERNIKEEIRMLPLWEGTYEEILAFTVPVLKETVKKFEKEQNDLEGAIEKTKEKIEQQLANIELYKESIRRLDSLVEIPSQDQLLDIRSTRDAGWKIIRTKLQTGDWDEKLLAYSNGEKIEDVYEEQVHEADHIADTMRLEAEKVGEKNKLLSDIEQCKKKIGELKEDEIGVRKDLNSLKEKWEELWIQTEISPLSPEEMSEWLGKYESIIAMIQDFKTTHDDLNEFEVKNTKLKDELLTVLNTFGNDFNEKSLDDLLNIAEKKLKATQELITEAKGLKTGIDDLVIKIKDKKSEIQDNDLKIKSWNSAWQQAIQNTSITSETSTTVAEKLIQRYEDCANAQEEFEKTEKDQKSIQKQNSLFNERVDKLLDTIEVSLDDQSYDMAVNKLYSLWQKADKDQVVYTKLMDQKNSHLMFLEMAKKELEESQSSMKDLFNTANCKDLEELKEIENKFLMKNEYDQNIQNIEEEMLNLGEGKSIQELIAEAKQYESDSIDIELEEIDRDLGKKDEERSQLERDYGVVKKEYEDKVQGNNMASVQVEQERNSIHEKIVTLADEYIQLKLASILLQKGIEDYRSRNQNPIIKRAGEIFNKLTLGSFTDLTVDYDDKDQPILMGLRDDGGNVAINGMSDGTKDQLYLSLRIASIEKYVAENEPIPFIVDDILIHFDDKRSKETLKILKELSKHTQIIFFTHHTRLLELMKEVSMEDEYQVIEINNNEPMLSH